MTSSSENIRVEKIKNNDAQKSSMALEESQKFFMTGDFSAYPAEWVVVSGFRLVAHNKDIRLAYADAFAQGYDRSDLLGFRVPEPGIHIY